MFKGFHYLWSNLYNHFRSLFWWFRWWRPDQWILTTIVTDERRCNRVLHEYSFSFLNMKEKIVQSARNKTSCSSDALRKQVIKNWFSNLKSGQSFCIDRFQDTEAELNPCSCNKWWSICYQYSSQRCKEFNSYVYFCIVFCKSNIFSSLKLIPSAVL